MITEREHSLPGAMRRGSRFQPDRRGIAPLEFLMALPCLVFLFALILHSASLIRQKYQLENDGRHETWRERYDSAGSSVAQSVPQWHDPAGVESSPPSMAFQRMERNSLLTLFQVLPLYSELQAQYTDEVTSDKVTETLATELQRPADFLSGVEADIRQQSDDARRQLDSGMETLSSQKQKVVSALNDFEAELKSEVTQKNTELNSWQQASKMPKEWRRTRH